MRIGRFLDRITSFAIMGVTAVCIYPANILFLRKISSYSVHYMVFLLIIGLFFLLIRQKKLLFISFACCAVLCLYFKLKVGITIEQPFKTEEPTLRLAHLSTTALSGNWESNLQVLKNGKWDVLSIVELTPDWAILFQEELSETFPYSISLERIDNYGLGIYSKFPIHEIDTLFYENIPNLLATIQVAEDYNCLISCSNTDPPLYRKSFLQLKEQLNTLAQNFNQKDIPIITTGNFNLDQFSDELQDFRALAGLSDSRMTMSPSLNPPTHHIFSKKMTCLSFSNIYNNTYRIGIQGEFQFNNGGT